MSDLWAMNQPVSVGVVHREHPTAQNNKNKNKKQLLTIQQTTRSALLMHPPVMKLWVNFYFYYYYQRSLSVRVPLDRDDIANTISYTRTQIKKWGLIIDWWGTILNNNDSNDAAATFFFYFYASFANCCLYSLRTFSPISLFYFMRPTGKCWLFLYTAGE